MMPLVVEDANGVVLFSCQFKFDGGPVAVQSSKGGSLHNIDNNSPMVKVIIPTADAVEAFTPSDDPNQLTFNVESADTAAERTATEEETNRIAGTIKPQGSDVVFNETVSVYVGGPEPKEEEVATSKGNKRSKEEDKTLELK